MANRMTSDAISLILANPCPDSSSDMPEIVVQVTDLKATGAKYMFMANDGKKKVRALLQSTLSSEVTSGNIQNLGLIRILDYTLNDIPTKNEKKELGPPDYKDVIGMGAALDYLETTGRQQIHKYEAAMVLYFYEGLRRIHKLRIYGPEPSDFVMRAPVFIFNAARGVCAKEIAKIMDQEYGIIIGAPRLHYLRFGAPTSARVSLRFYNSVEDLDECIRALKVTIKRLRSR